MKISTLLLSVSIAVAASAAFASNPEGRGLSFSAAVDEGYNSNVNAEKNAVGSLYTEVDAGARYRFGSPRLKIEAQLDGSLSYYYETSKGDNLFPNVEFRLQSEYSLDSRSTILFETSSGFLSQPSFTTPGSYNGQGDYFISSNLISYEHLWSPLFSSITSWDGDFYLYATPEYQTSLGRMEQTFGNQILYLWKPQTSLVQEYRINPRTYFEDRAMDSLGQYFLFGLNQTFNPKFNLVARAGVEQRWLSEPDGGNGGYVGPYGELRLGYQGGLTDASLGAQYGTQSSGLVGVGESNTFQLLVNASRKIGTKTTLDFFSSYQFNQFDQQQTIPSFNDNVLDIGAGVNHRITRRVSLGVGYRYSTVVSTGAEEPGWQRNIIFAGAKVDF